MILAIVCNFKPGFYSNVSQQETNPMKIFVITRILTGILVTLLSSSAHSDVFIDNLNLSFTDGSTFVGSVTIDTLNPLNDTATGTFNDILGGNANDHIQGLFLASQGINPISSTGEFLDALIDAPSYSSGFGDYLYVDILNAGANPSLGANTETGAGAFLSSTVSLIPLSPPVSSVPVPAAFWLFSSVLTGFIGFNRRQSMTRSIKIYGNR